MADFNFTVDAGKILAKMHRGGCQTHGDMVYINTGILNDAKGATPEQVDGTKMTFNFEAGSWCEIGVIFENPMKLKLKYSEEELQAIAKEKKEVDGKEEKEGGEKAQGGKGGDEEGDEEEGDEQEQVNEADEGASEQDKKASIGDKPEPAAADKPGEKKEEKPGDEKKEEKPGEKDGGEKPGGEDEEDDDEKSDDEGEEKLGPEAEKKKEENLKSFQDAIQKKKQLAVAYIKDYMTVFGGKESADKINEKGVVITFLEDKWADPSKVKEYKDGQIPAMDDKAIAEMINAQLKDGKDDKELELKNVCFKAAYSVSVKVED